MEYILTVVDFFPDQQKERFTYIFAINTQNIKSTVHSYLINLNLGIG